MALVADAVDADAVLLEEFHDTHGALELGTQVLQVVVIVVKLRCGIGGGGGTEGNGDVCLANNAEEDAVAVGAVLIQRLVDHVPVVAPALVPAHNLVDVVRHDVDQRRVVEVAIGHPARQLRVPDERMAAYVYRQE